LPFQEGNGVTSVFQQYPLAEDVWRQVITGVLETIHEGRADSSRDELAEGAAVGVYTGLAEGEDLL
jgi:hypothetical protein